MVIQHYLLGFCDNPGWFQKATPQTSKSGKKPLLFYRKKPQARPSSYEGGGWGGGVEGQKEMHPTRQWGQWGQRSVCEPASDLLEQTSQRRDKL